MRIKYKNEIFNYLLTNKWDINDFNVDDNEFEFIVQYKVTPLKFKFYFPNDFDFFFPSWIVYSPNWRSDGTNLSDWYTTFKLFRKWLITIKNYIDDQNAIDLWDEYLKGNSVVYSKNIDFDNQDNFTPDEQQQLRMSINELKGLIINKFELLEEQQKIVNDRLDYLAEASVRLNKFDWKGTLVNTIMSISIALSLDTEKGKILLKLFQRIFQNIKGLLS